MLRVGPQRAVFGDLRSGIPTRAADPRDLFWMRQGNRFELAVEMDVPHHLASARWCRYEVAVGFSEEGEPVSILAENLWLANRKIEDSSPEQRRIFPFPPTPPESILQTGKGPWKKIIAKTHTGNDYFRSETSDWNNQFRLGPTKSALANLPEDESRFPVSIWVKRTLMEGIQFIRLNSEAMRVPSPPGLPNSFLPDGSNLAWVVAGLATEHKEAWLKHVRTSFEDIRDIHVHDRPEDRHRYLEIEYTSGLRAPSWVVSDGTLRLLALTLLAYLPELSGLVLIEEPENGIHPRAVETTFASLSSVYGAQVLCATHSPVILSMAEPDAVLCFAKAEGGATDVVLGTEHPNLSSWKGDVDLGTLLAAGVLG